MNEPGIKAPEVTMVLIQKRAGWAGVTVWDQTETYQNILQNLATQNDTLTRKFLTAVLHQVCNQIKIHSRLNAEDV